jgi:WhiB family transcriptional regulator, redox-sensing transcriptional regulator
VTVARSLPLFDWPATVPAAERVAVRPADGWSEYGACRDVDDDEAAADFFPAKGDGEAAARAVAVCGRCPVQQDCLAWALWNSERYGIWGGTTYPTRRKLAAQYHGTSARALAGCGFGIDGGPCGPCQAALMRRARGQQDGRDPRP